MCRILATAIATVVTLAVAAATLTSAGAGETTAVQATTGGVEAQLDRYRSQRLAWGPCEADTPRFECATLRAPRDWHHPGSGPDITLAISRLPADPATRTGILLLDGGGPASHLDLPLDFENTPIGDAYDLIGYDPRGIGRSTAIACLTQAEISEYLRVDMRDPQNYPQIQENARATARACAERSGELLRYVTTDQIVRDWDLVRTLLDAPRLNVLGFSAGTWLGAHYAAVFPDRVGRMVLDSNTEFTATMQTVVANQPAAFERRFDDDFLAWIARHDATYHYGVTAQRARARWEARREALPMRVSDAFTLQPADLDNLTAGLLYHQNDFPLLAQLLSIIERLGEATQEERQLVEEVFTAPLASPGVLAMYLAITCNDTPWDPVSWARQSAQLNQRYPLTGPQAFFQPCIYWPYRQPEPTPITGGVPILMVNSVTDPATPYAGALRAHRGFRDSRLVTVLDGDHVQYGRTQDPCVDRAIHRYLIDGALPRRDITCPGQEPPAP